MDQRFRIRELTEIAPDVVRCVVEAPRVAEHTRPGQFVIVRLSDNGERIPLTISAHDPIEGTITLVVQMLGATTHRFAGYVTGDHLTDVLGPLGTPTEIRRFGNCVVVGGGVGVAIALPVARALHEAGNSVRAVVGARTESRLVLVEEMTAVADSVAIMTDDGTAGTQGLVTDGVRESLARIEVDFVFTVGPVPMMAAVAELTREAGIPTVASLNPIMIDGTGMCGGCRVNVGGDTKFACVDGPEFDAHAVDFAVLDARNRAYREFEKCRMAELVDG